MHRSGGGRAALPIPLRPAPLGRDPVPGRDRFIVFLSAVGIYHFEGQQQPEAFGSVFHCLWWAIVTLTTVGYGDVYPVTIGGRVFTVLILMVGIGVVAVPTGLLASALNIRPIIGVDKSTGKYAQLGRARTFKRAVQALGDIVAKQHPIGTKMRVQLLHGRNLEAAEQLQARFEELFECTFIPTTAIAPVLGAHTGPGLVGAAYAPLDSFPAMP